MFAAVDEQRAGRDVLAGASVTSSRRARAAGSVAAVYGAADVVRYRALRPGNVTLLHCECNIRDGRRPAVTDLDAADFFRGDELIDDPYPYYEHLRDRCPVTREPHHAVLMVTGYDEAIAIYNDTERFSSCNSVTARPVPGPLTGDAAGQRATTWPQRRDRACIDAHRDELPFSDQLPTFDPPKHTAHRGLLMRLITPKRLKENEDFMWRLADRQIDEFLATGDREFIAGYAQPFAMLRGRRPARRARERPRDVPRGPRRSAASAPGRSAASTTTG